MDDERFKSGFSGNFNIFFFISIAIAIVCFFVLSRLLPASAADEFDGPAHFTGSFAVAYYNYDIHPYFVRAEASGLTDYPNLVSQTTYFVGHPSSGLDFDWTSSIVSHSWNELLLINGFLTLRASYASYDWDNSCYVYDTFINTPTSLVFPDQTNLLSFYKYSGSDQQAFSDGIYYLTTDGDIVLVSAPGFIFIESAGYAVPYNAASSDHNSYYTRTWDPVNLVWLNEAPEYMFVDTVLFSNAGTVYLTMFDSFNRYKDDVYQVPFSCGINFNIGYFSDTLVPSPSPTPEVSVPEYYSMLCYLNPVSGLAGRYGYYLLDFSMTSISDSVEVDVNNNFAYAAASSEYGVSSPFIRDVLFTTGHDEYGVLNLYIKGLISSITFYYIGVDLVSSDLDYIRSNFSAQSFVSNDYTSFSSSNGLSCLTVRLYYRYNFELLSSNFIDIVQLNVNTSTSYGSNNSFKYNDSSLSNHLTVAYRFGLTGSPEPTPDPNATPTPSPSPTPTNPPYIQIATPSLYPELFNYQYHNNIPQLSSNQSHSFFNGFLSGLASSSVGLFAWALNLLPAEPLTYLWYIIFFLLIVALCKVILHFLG